MVVSRIAPARGILNPAVAETRFQMNHYFPASDLSHLVLRYWIIRWDLRGQESYTQELLTYPCLNLVIEAGQSALYGVETQKSSHTLEGCGTVLGVKFRPGGFYPFFKRSISELTNRALPLSDVFGIDSASLEAAILSSAADGHRVTLVEDFLRQRLPPPDENVTLVNQIVDAINAERAITRVDHVACRFHMSRRTLERLFSQYVGVSPKWVIQRARLHEAAEKLARDEKVDLPRLALDLGYFDQAHFIKDFKTIIGTTPGDYARRAGTG